jgi:heme/copper-type cytochrome/quinol oxidase subunit 4
MAMITSIQFSFGAVDENAWVIAFVGYLIVFVALVALYFVFYSLPKLIKIRFKQIIPKKRATGKIADDEKIEEIEITGDVNAAIGMALFLHFNELHDEESNVMTIKRISRAYSPWSSKIYAVRNQFNRI